MILRACLAMAVVLTRALSADAQPLSPRNANYTIDVTLDARARTLSARETLVWTNITNASTDELQFHLYYNAWRNDESTWMREHTLTSWWQRASTQRAEDRAAIDISSFAITGGAIAPADLTRQMRFIAPDDGNKDDRTVMSVALPEPIGPGETLTIDIAFTAKIPRPFARTGAIGNYFFIAQWFPKIGVLDAAGTWNCHQFHVGTEFFSDFGVYDVRMTVPRGWPVAATGRQRERTDNPNGTTTHRYYQEDVHDFAWTTSPDFLEARERFEQPGLPPVDMRLLYQPEHASQTARHFETARATLRYYGEWFGAYPYGHLTIVDTPWRTATDGMEYPTMFTAGTRWLMPREDTYVEDTVVHEAGHQWWYGMVATNEFEDAWMDEGINQYANARVDAEDYPYGREVLRFFGGFVPWVLDDVPWDRLASGEFLERLPQQPDRRHTGDAVFSILAADVRPHHLFEAGAVAAHARARARVAGGAADSVDVLRSLEVQAPETRRPVPGCQRSERPRSDAVLRSGVPRLGRVRLRRRQRHELGDRR